VCTILYDLKGLAEMFKVDGDDLFRTLLSIVSERTSWFNSTFLQRILREISVKKPAWINSRRATYNSISNLVADVRIQFSGDKALAFGKNNNCF
jgi:hypothetical protein